jgi:hypothetical protein
MKQLLFVPACFISLLSIAQNNLSFTQGPDFELPKKSTNLDFFYTPQGLVNFSLNDKTAFTDVFNISNMAKSNENKATITRSSGTFNNEMIADMGKNHYWLHSDWDADTDKSTLYFDKVDPVTGQLLSVDNKMFEVSKVESDWAYKGLAAFTIGNYSNAEVPANVFNLHLSPDHKKMLVAYRYTTKDDVYQTIGVALYDETLKKIWSNEYVMPIRAQVVSYEDYAVDNKGNAYVLAITQDNYPQYKRNGDIILNMADKNTGKANYHYILSKFTKDSKTVIQSEYDQGSYFVSDGHLLQDTQNKGIFFAGDYNKTPNTSGVDGICIGKINDDGVIKPYLKGFYEFPVEEANKYKSESTLKKEAKKKIAPCASVRINNIILDKDGGLLVAGEDYSFVPDPIAGSQYSVNVNPAEYIDTWHYNDIYAIKIDATGDLAWGRKIPKNQKAARQQEFVKGHVYSGTISCFELNGPVSMSYKVISNPSGGYDFLYMDNKENEGLDETKEPETYIAEKGSKGGQFVAVQIDNSGKINRQVLTEVTSDVEISPTSIIQINDKTYAGRLQTKEYNYTPFELSFK